MEIHSREVLGTGLRFSVTVDGSEVGRAYLYILRNDLHQQPFGFMEDVFVHASQRGQGVGSEMVKNIIEEARRRGCYKLVCTSRYVKSEVHDLYKKLGFTDHGKEFRLDY